jgi:glycosyltransferase involved in cell wall biosynthesis
MKFLILSQYYPPETGAPQNRLHSLALNLVKYGCELEVLTAMPNYPKMEVFDSYRGLSYFKEHIDGIKVHRSKIYVSKSKGVFKRLLNYFSFVLSSIRVSNKLSKTDYIICESPPLFLGISALYLSKKLKAKLIFNVSDLWPETAEKLDIVNNKFFLNLAYKLEKYLYKKSFLVTCQTQGIEININKRFPNIPTLWLPNGIDKEVYDVPENKDWITEYGIEGKRIYVYAGIIGHAQGLDVIIKAKNWLVNNEFALSKKVAFVIIGDGPDKQRLEALNEELKTNIIFIPNTPKIEVLKMLKACHGYIVPLKKLDLFLGAIPSKIFDALAFSKPILLGVDGEAKSLFIDKGKAGIYFEPENEISLAEAVIKLESNPIKASIYGDSGFIYATKNFDRKNIAKKLLKKIQNLNIIN